MPEKTSKFMAITEEGQYQRFQSMGIKITHYFVQKLNMQKTENDLTNIFISGSKISKNDSESKNIFLFSKGKEKHEEKQYAQNSNFTISQVSDKEFTMTTIDNNEPIVTSQRHYIDLSATRIYLPTEDEYKYWKEHLSKLPDKYPVKLSFPEASGTATQEGLFGSFEHSHDVENQSDYLKEEKILKKKTEEIFEQYRKDKEFQQIFIEIVFNGTSSKKHKGIEKIKTEYGIFYNSVRDYINKNNLYVSSTPEEYIKQLYVNYYKGRGR